MPNKTEKDANPSTAAACLLLYPTGNILTSQGESKLAWTRRGCREEWIVSDVCVFHGGIPHKLASSRGRGSHLSTNSMSTWTPLPLDNDSNTDVNSPLEVEEGNRAPSPPVEHKPTLFTPTLTGTRPNPDCTRYFCCNSKRASIAWSIPLTIIAMALWIGTWMLSTRTRHAGAAVASLSTISMVLLSLVATFLSMFSCCAFSYGTRANVELDHEALLSHV